MAVSRTGAIHTMTLTHDGRTSLLAGCALFSGVGPEGLAMLAERASEVDYGPGAVIVRHGEIGTGFFVIVEGNVRVIQDGVAVARLGSGDFFGELSVLDQLPRNAQVTADGPVRCLALASWEFERVLLEHPVLALAILRGLARRMRSVAESHRS